MATSFRHKNTEFVKHYKKMIYYYSIKCFTKSLLMHNISLGVELWPRHKI